MEISEDTLRQYVRGELDATERRAVTRWLIRCGDPEVPSILQGLIREAEDERADERLLEKLPNMRPLVDAWKRLLDDGRAVWEEISSSSAIPAMGTLKAGERVTAGLRFRPDRAKDDDEISIDVVIPEEGHFVLIATSDAGDEHHLLEPTLLPAGTHPDVARWQIDEADGRVTFWLGSLPDTQEDAPTSGRPTLRELLEGADQGEIELIAVRWDPSQTQARL